MSNEATDKHLGETTSATDEPHVEYIPPKKQGGYTPPAEWSYDETVCST